MISRRLLWQRILQVGCAAVLLGTCLADREAHAGLVFNVTYDSSVSSAPAGFTTAFNNAINFIESNYSDPITINLHVGWGEINGSSLAPGNLGQSEANGANSFFNYAQIKTALTADAKTADDATAVAHLPAIDPTRGASFDMSRAEGKALGLVAGNSSGIDGWVGFNSVASYTFDPSNRAVSGKFDFIGLAEHEITEVMGRFGQTQNGFSSGEYSPIDMFRYRSAGVIATTPVNGTYFSINGGSTVINTFNANGAPGAGDYSDWAGSTFDSFNHSLASGVELPFSAGDLTLMDVLGYDRVSAVPEPTTLSLLTVGLGGLLPARRRRISR